MSLSSINRCTGRRQRNQRALRTSSSDFEMRVSFLRYWKFSSAQCRITGNSPPPNAEGLPSWFSGGGPDSRMRLSSSNQCIRRRQRKQRAL
ncbi:hypothetical protein L1887_10244 [Cichorium endivia]|nr:hypothetical protein L1887_10244 [Cichorium endivia]